jgi:glutathione S-transferase
VDTNAVPFAPPFARIFASMAEHSHLTLYYFDIHGLGARIRLAARLSGLSLADVRFSSRDEFATMKAAGTLPFGQVPLLVVRLPNAAEPVHLAQSGAILRYVCTLGGLQPLDPLQGAAVDAAVAAESDAFRCVPP